MEAFGLPETFDFETLRALVERRRGRQLRLASMPAPLTQQAPYGMWVSLLDEDVIFVDQRTSALHQNQIALHEIAHIMCGHDGAAALHVDDFGQLLPNLDHAMVKRVLGRASYGYPQEREAELVATLLGTRLRPEPADAGGGRADTIEDDVLRKLVEALGGQVGGS